MPERKLAQYATVFFFEWWYCDDFIFSVLIYNKCYKTSTTFLTGKNKTFKNYI